MVIFMGGSVERIFHLLSAMKARLARFFFHLGQHCLVDLSAHPRWVLVWLWSEYAPSH
jgi:hypothetical protein